MPKKFEAPNLANATPEMLVDEMGKLSMVENYAKKMRAFYKEALYARKDIKVEEFLNGQEVQSVGETFVATTSRSDPNRVNVKRLQAEDPETAAKYTESNAQLTTRFSLKEGVVNPIVSSLMDQIKSELDLD